MHAIKGLIGKFFPDSPKGSDSEQPEFSPEITPTKLKTQTPPISQRLRTRTKQLTHESEARAASTPTKRQKNISTTARNHVHLSTISKGRKRGSKESTDEQSGELSSRMENSEENHQITTKKRNGRKRSYDEDRDTERQSHGIDDHKIDEPEDSTHLSENSDDFEKINFTAPTDEHMSDDNILTKAYRKKSSRQLLSPRVQINPDKSHAEVMNSNDENNEADIENNATLKSNSSRKLKQSKDKVEAISDVEANSDDEAPETVSMAQGKKKAVAVARAEKAAATRLKSAEKSKRRIRDQKLKEQSKSSRVATEKKSNASSTLNPIDIITTSNSTITEAQAKDTAPALPSVLPTLLPQDLLDDVAKIYKEEKKKRRHLHTEDFEPLEKEEQSKAIKKKKIGGTKNFGSFDVAALEKVDPFTTLIPENIKIFRERHFFGSEHIPRKDAILNYSQKRRGAAVRFRRSGMESKNFSKKAWTILKTGGKVNA